MTTPSLEADDLTVSYRRDGRAVRISESVDLRVMPGESVAIVGESGSGKSVTARAVLDLLPANLTATGGVEVGGRQFLKIGGADRRRMRGGDIAFIMQDPFTMLNPVVRVVDQVTAALRDAKGRPLRRAARERAALVRLAEVGITEPEVLERYPFELSGGMRQRVAIAAAVAENPRVLIADEPTTALDVTTQTEVLQLLGRLRTAHSMALVLITHDLRVAFSACDRVYVMYAGQIVEVAESDTVRRSPRHPYTAALLEADPPVDHRVRRLPTIPGSVPSPGQWPPGCRYAPRCSFAHAECATSVPALTAVATGHEVRCVRVDEIADDVRTTSTTVPDADPIDTATAVPLVTARGARKVFGRKVAVAGADIDVFAGESVGLVGESGSGKTTLARMIVGLTLPDSGQVTVGGVELRAGHRLGRDDWAVVRSTAQMAFQDPYSTLNPSRTVGSAIKDGLRLAGHNDLRAGVVESLERVGLPGSYAGRRPSQLSGGERQRVAIARALSRDPKVLVCDEVVSALDVSVQAHILNLLRGLQRELGLTYVFITHDLAVVRQITDRVYVVNRGEIVEQGPTGRVLDEPEHEYTRKLIASIPDVDLIDKSL